MRRMTGENFRVYITKRRFEEEYTRVHLGVFLSFHFVSLFIPHYIHLPNPTSILRVKQKMVHWINECHYRKNKGSVNFPQGANIPSHPLFVGHE
jgi:hypothetical protein